MKQRLWPDTNTADMHRLLSRNYWFLEALEQLGSETSWDFVLPPFYRMAAPPPLSVISLFIQF